MWSERPTIQLGLTHWVRLAINPRGPFTDRFSNTVSLKNADAARYFESGLVGELQGSDSLIRHLLHESTHHASFAGPFGNALAALACSSSGLSGPGVWLLRGEHGFPLGQRDRMVLEWADTVYGPLIEGLALFAEYDLYSGPINQSSHALLHTRSLYLKRVTDAAVEEAAAELNRLLCDGVTDIEAMSAATARSERVFNDYLRREVRLSPDAREQKESLLRQPLLEPPEGERQYLLGYLATKRAYLALRRAQPAALGSTDIFHMVMQHHWFSDEEDAHALLSIDDCHPLLVQQATIGHLSERFQDKWDALYDGPMVHLKALLQRLDNVQRGVEVSLGESAFLHGIRTAPQSLHPFAPKLLKHRLTLRYSGTPADVSVDAARVAEVRDRSSGLLVGRCPAVSLSDSGKFPAMIELVQSYDRTLQAMVLLGPTGLVSSRCLLTGQWNAAAHVKAFDDLPSLEHVLAAMQDADAKCAGDYRLSSNLDDLRAHLREQARGLRDETFLQLAFPLQQAVRRSCAHILSESGFAGLLRSDWEMRVLAHYSLAFGGEGSTWEDGAGLLGEPVSAVRDRVQAFNSLATAALGVEMFEVADGQVTSAI